MQQNFVLDVVCWTESDSLHWQSSQLVTHWQLQTSAAERTQSLWAQWWM